MSAFLACDWGTTNLRAWVIGEDGSVGPERGFDLGVSKLRPGEAAARFRDEVRPAMNAHSLPALMAGMIGSTLGWTVVPYEDCPVGIDDLSWRLFRVDEPGPPVRIVPGVKGRGLAGAPDVMRGEETQVFGWLAADPERARGRKVVCHPGTHAKWILIEDGRIVRFVTAMTGELFSLLSKHSVLRTDGAGHDEAAFLKGLEAAGDGGALSARLFTVRARVVAGNAPAASSAGYLSGLLIGSDAAALPGLLGIGTETPVELVGEPELCRLYDKALTWLGYRTAVHDGDEAVLAGLKALWRAGGGA